MVQPAPDGIRWPRHNAATLLAGVVVLLLQAARAGTRAAAYLRAAASTEIGHFPQI
jgi:hypothetical protein